jgi:hypothetical protein
MSARVFISYRTSDGADKATALARDLDALFGEEQIFLDKDDLPAGSRWRDVIARTLEQSPILLVLVTPNYLGARDSQGKRCIERDDDPPRDELQAGLAARAQVIPLMCDGVTAIPAAADLPKPFDQLCERTWRKLRAYDWREDLNRLATDLRALGVVPRTTPGEFGAAPLPLAGDIGASVAIRRRRGAGPSPRSVRWSSPAPASPAGAGSSKRKRRRAPTSPDAGARTSASAARRRRATATS